MSLATNVIDLATRVATESKALRTMINGNAPGLTALTTTQKSSLVAAINEIAAAVANSSGISDTDTSTSTAWSSSKTQSEIQAAAAAIVASSPAALDTLNELSAALNNDPNFATTITTALGNRVRFDAAQTLTSTEQAQARNNIAAGTSNLTIGTTATTAKAGNYQPIAANISDSTVTGRSVLTAIDAPAARSAIGAGTSNLVLGTTSSTAKAGDYTPPTATETVSGVVELATTAEATTGIDTVRAVTPAGLKTVADTKAPTSHTHAADNISDSTAVGRLVLTAVDATAARTAIGAGTSSLVIGSTSTTAKAGNYTPPTATDTVSGLVELATTAEATTGTDTARAVTPAGLKAVADTKAQISHSHIAAQISDATATGRSVLTALDASAARTAIGAGTGSSNLILGTAAGTAADAAAVTSALATKANTADVGDTNTNFVAVFEAGLI